MLDAAALIQKHRSKGALVDANLLVLLLVGSANRNQIERFKRTQNFTIEDYDMLQKLVVAFGRLFTTPHVLSQASDLTDMPGKDLATVRRLFIQVVDETDLHVALQTRGAESLNFNHIRAMGWT